MMKLTINGRTYEGKTAIECIREAYANYERLYTGMNEWLTEFDEFDEEGELIIREYTDDEYEYAFDHTTDMNPQCYDIDWSE